MSTLLAVLVDGVIYASWLFLIAAGLTMIYGVMRILNMAHGSLYALGAYAAASLAGAWLARRATRPSAATRCWSLAAIARRRSSWARSSSAGSCASCYGRDEVVLVLVTYALFLILEDVVKLVWGVESYFVSEPYGLLGNFEIGDALLPDLQRASSCSPRSLVGLALRFGIYGTRYGKLLLAVIHDREMSAALGIDVNRMFLVTFTLGTHARGDRRRAHRADGLGRARDGGRGDRARLRGGRHRRARAACRARRSARSSSGSSARPRSTSSRRSSSSASTS